MGKRGYPPEFRRRVLDLVATGRKVTDVARDLEISSQTIYNWRRQDRIDQGLEPGLSSAEHAELLAALCVPKTRLALPDQAFCSRGRRRLGTLGVPRP